MTRKEEDPLAKLDNIPRTIGPRHLTGKNKETWVRFVNKYKNGDYAGLSLRQLHRDLSNILGLQCSIYTFKRSLFDQAGIDKHIK